MASGRRATSAASAALAALALVAGACGGGGATSSAPSTPGSGSTTTGQASHAPSVNPVIGFTMRGGDAFAWSERVSGTGRCHDKTLSVNGRSSGAKVSTRGSSFHATVPLRPGRNSVTARCTTQAGAVERSAPLVWNERLQARPTASIRVTVAGDIVTMDGSHSAPTQPFGSRVSKYTWSPDPRRPSKLELASGKPFTGHVAGPRLQLRAPSLDREYFVSLTVADAEGRRDTSTTYFVVRDGRASPADPVRDHPSWIDSAVIYAPIPILWGNGGPKTIERHLPYLKRLGVDALWLWPPTEQREYGEEYRITDYFKLDP